MSRVDEIRERLNKATPGPWYWHGVKSQKDIDLLSFWDGHQRVMGFARWGTNQAAPVFRTEQGMQRVDELTIPRQEHRPDGEFLQVNHPDAELIAHAPDDIDYLLQKNKMLLEALKSVNYLVANRMKLKPLMSEYCIWNDIEQVSGQAIEGANK